MNESTEQATIHRAVLLKNVNLMKTINQVKNFNPNSMIIIVFIYLNFNEYDD